MRRVIPAALWSLATIGLLSALVFAQSTTGVFMGSQTGITGFAMPNGSASAPSYGFSSNGTAGLFLDQGFYTTVKGPDITGTDQAGGAMQIYPGKGTGTGGGGTVYIATCPANSGSGSTANTCVNQALFEANGGILLGGVAGIDINSGAVGASQWNGGNAATGRSNTAGGALTLRGGLGTGTGNGGNFVVQVAPAGSTGSTQNAAQTVIQASGADATLTLGGTTSSGTMGHVSLVDRTFANLGTPSNGVIAYCSDCTIANPCAGSGNGALAKRLNGAWVCN